MENDVKQKLDELIYLIKSSDLYPKYQSSKSNIAENEETTSLLNTYKNLSSKLQKRAIEGLEPDDEDVKKFTSFSLLAFDNEDIVNYISSEITMQNHLSEIIRYMCKELDIEL